MFCASGMSRIKSLFLIKCAKQAVRPQWQLLNEHRRKTTSVCDLRLVTQSLRICFLPPQDLTYFGESLASKERNHMACSIMISFPSALHPSFLATMAKPAKPIQANPDSSHCLRQSFLAQCLGLTFCPPDQPRCLNFFMPQCPCMHMVMRKQYVSGSQTKHLKQHLPHSKYSILAS